MRGNPDNLRQAAAHKSAAAQARAEQGLRQMIRRQQPITLRSLAQTAGVSLDFRTLTAQLAERKRRHREDVQSHRQALDTAQGEILDLRRRLGHRHSTQAD
jgi:hypothetical protein